MPELRFGEWLPDQSPNSGAGVPFIKNAVPSATGYLPVPGIADSGESGITGIASLLFHVSDAARNVFGFAGVPTKLYKLASGSGFSDVSQVPGYTAGTPWRWARYGDFIYVVNGIDGMQSWELGVSSLFADATGIPSELTGRFICVLRDFLVLGYQNDSGGTPVPNRVRWCALGNPADWTVSQITQASYQDIPDLGEVRGITGGDYMTVLMEYGLVRADYVGPPPIIQFDQVEGAVGCREPASVIRVHNITYYYSPEGWYAFDGQRSNPIGAEKIDRWFRANAQADRLPLMSAINIPQWSAVGWLFTSVNTPDGLHDKILLHAYDVKRWGLMDVAAIDCLGTSATTGLSVEDMDTLYPSGAETAPGSVDDAIWKGSDDAQVAAIKGGDLYYLNGAVLQGVLETLEGSFNPFGHAVAMEAAPLVDGDCSLSMEVGTRDLSNTSSPTWVDADPFDATTGLFPLRHEGKFHRFRLAMDGDWQHAVGVNIKAKAVGRR